MIFLLYRMHLSVGTVAAAVCLVKYLFGTITARSEHLLAVLKTSITLLLLAMCKIQALAAQNMLDPTRIRDVFVTCEKILGEWVANHNVIGGSIFGGSVDYSWTGRRELKRAKSELEV